MCRLLGGQQSAAVVEKWQIGLDDSWRLAFRGLDRATPATKLPPAENFWRPRTMITQLLADMARMAVKRDNIVRALSLLKMALTFGGLQIDKIAADCATMLLEMVHTDVTLALTLTCRYMLESPHLWLVKIVSAATA